MAGGNLLPNVGDFYEDEFRIIKGYAQYTNFFGGVVLLSGYGNDNAFLSTDTGNNWMQGPSTTQGGIAEVCYGSNVNRYVSVGWLNPTSDPSVRGNAMYSNDGYDWTETTIPAGKWCAVAATKKPISGKGSSLPQFMATSVDGLITTSTDGIFWTDPVSPIGYANLRSVTHNGGVWCVCVYYSSTILTSIDGVDWTTNSVPDSLSWTSIASHGTTLAMIAQNSDQVVLSLDDGSSWTSVTLPFSSNWRTIAGNENSLVVTAYNGGESLVSFDKGLTWTEVAIPKRYTANIPGPYSMQVKDGVYYGIPYNTESGNGVMLSSTDDGRSWQWHDLPITDYWFNKPWDD